MRKILTPKEWSSHIQAQSVGSKTVKSYCHDNSLDLSSFYRQRRMRGENATGEASQAFVRAPALLSRSVSTASLTIRVGDFTLALDSGPQDLERVLLALAKVQYVLHPE